MDFVGFLGGDQGWFKQLINLELGDPIYEAQESVYGLSAAPIALPYQIEEGRQETECGRLFAMYSEPVCIFPQEGYSKQSLGIKQIVPPTR